MDYLIAVCGFVGGWLLVFGPPANTVFTVADTQKTLNPDAEQPARRDRNRA